MTFAQPRLAACCLVFFVSFAYTITVAAQASAAKTEPDSSAVEKKLLASAEEPKPAVVTTASEAVAPETSKAVTSETSSVTNTATAKPKPQNSSNKGWQFIFRPYLWIAGINGTAGLPDPAVEISSGITDSNVHVNFGFMSSFEARKGKFVSLTDLQYSNLGTDRPNPGPLFSGATASFKTFILDPEVGYRVAGSIERGKYVEVLGGFRYIHLKTDLTFEPGVLPGRSASRSSNWADGVGGVLARTRLSRRWFVTGKGDLGGGGSKFTYQLVGAVGFFVSKNVAIVGGYRYLHIDRENNRLLFDVAISGAILGIGFKF